MPASAEVRTMFASVARSYDRVNQILSFGMHHGWRRAAVRLSGVRPGDRVLDCATGTGDLALEFKRAVGATGAVTGTDFCAEMLALAPAKADRAGLPVRFEVADVLALRTPAHPSTSPRSRSESGTSRTPRAEFGNWPGS